MSRNTGERLETNFFNKTTIEHLHRYALACEFAEGKVVLDIASGEGYGANLLSNNASFVYGVDIDKETVIIAEEKYIKSNLKFLHGSTSKIPLEDSTVDLVVSFETIEHHNEHEQMMKEIKRVLKAEGILIISTPDKKFYSDLRNYKNPFHVKELYKNEFENLVSKYFKKTQVLSQGYLFGNSLIFNNLDKDEMVLYTGSFSQIKTKSFNPNFILIIGSNSEFKKTENSIFDGGNEILSMNENEILKRFQKSNSYKVGNFILQPLKIIKRYIKKYFP
jgi:ubiquinone/menaquinone biosynthesis C-methylase UbiE